MTGEVHRKPKFDIYSTMLAIAFVAMLIGTLFAYLETSDYKTEKTRGAPPVSIVMPVRQCTLAHLRTSSGDDLYAFGPRAYSAT